MEQKQSRRSYGIDLVRLVSFFAITIHHFIWVMWYAPHPPSDETILWRFTEIYARAISFSGHTILFLSCFLIARAESRVVKTWKVVLFVAFGWVLFCWFERGQNEVFWIWDIYPLIMLGLATGSVAARLSSRFIYVLGVVGFLMTFFPFWELQYFNEMSLQFRHWWVGDCKVDLADWPILPWVGFLWAPFALGTLERKRAEAGQAPFFSRWYKLESILWPAALLAAVPFWGAFYNITIGPLFACFSFRQPPQIFWGHFIYVLFFLRVSLLDSVQAELAKFRIVRFVANLRHSTMFGAAYMFHYFLIEIEKNYAFDLLNQSPYYSMIACWSVIPITEISIRGIEWSVRTLVTRLRRDGSSKPSV